MRLGGSLTNSPGPGDSIDLALLDASGNVVDGGTLPFLKSFDTDEVVLYRQFKLYNSAGQSILPGVYRVRAILRSNGAEQAMGTFNLDIR